MFANINCSGFLALVVGFALACPALAENNNLDWTITEAQEPDGKAWEDPARFSFSIDPKGEDIFSAQINVEIGTKLGRAMVYSDPKFKSGRDVALNTFVRWNRESGGDDKQNNFELGGNIKVGRNLSNLYDVDENFDSLTAEERSDLADVRSKSIDYSFTGGVGYARTASYADVTAAPCDSNPNLLQCRTQHKESVRAKGEIALYSPSWHGINRVTDKKSGIVSKPSFAHIFSPKFGLAYDYLINNVIDPKTLVIQRGGYLSTLAGLKVELSPSFISPRFEFSLDAQIRQALARSTTRAPTLDKTAERIELSATYYPVLPGDITNSQIRLGVGVTYTRGHDPLVGEPKGSKIVLALRAGFY